MTGWSPRAERRWAIAVTLLVLLPFGAAAIHLLVDVGDSYLPVGDWSLLEMRVRDVGHQWLTTGAYSRFGWYHPGPLPFYVLAVPYRLLGSHSVDLRVGAVLIGAASVAAAALLAWRRGGLPVVVAVLVPVTVLVHAAGPVQMQDPWNPLVAILPFVVVMVLAWSVALGDAWMAVALVAVSSFVVQAHVGYVVPVVAVGVVAVLGAVVAARRDGARTTRGRWRIAVPTAAILGTVLWLPVLWGTVVHGDGNLAAIVRFNAGGHRHAGLGAALRTMGAAVWGPRPEWIVGPRRPGPAIVPAGVDGRWWLACGVVALAAAGAWAWRRRDRVGAAIVAIAAAGVAAGVIAIARVVGPVAWYLVRWTWALGAVLGVAVLVVVLRTFDGRAGFRRLLPVVATMLVAVPAIAATVDAHRSVPLFDVDSQALRPVVTAVLRAVADRPGAVLVDLGRRRTEDQYDLGLQLERAGHPVTVWPPFASRYGKERVTARPSYGTRLVVVGPLNVPEPPPGARLIARDRSGWAVYEVPTAPVR